MPTNYWKLVLLIQKCICLNERQCKLLDMWSFITHEHINAQETSEPYYLYTMVECMNIFCFEHGVKMLWVTIVNYMMALYRQRNCSIVPVL